MKNLAYKVVRARKHDDFRSSSALGEHALIYKLNVSVIALPDTFGIFCFSDYNDAKSYLYRYFDMCFGVPRKILEVKTYGNPVFPKYIAKDCFCKAFYSTDGSLFYIKAPKGTVCFNKIVPMRVI